MSLSLSPQLALRYPAYAVALSLYNCFLEYMYVLGEPNVASMGRIVDYLSENAPNGVGLLLARAFVAQQKGHLNAAIELYDRFESENNGFKAALNICYWQRTWAHA